MDQEEEEQLFVASNQEVEKKLFVPPCYAKISQGITWLVDGGCKNHMTNNVKLFEELDRKSASKVRVGNGQYISVKEKGFKVHFKDKTCVIKDAKGLELFSVNMKRKIFHLDLMDKEHNANKAVMKTTDYWQKIGVCSS